MASPCNADGILGSENKCSPYSRIALAEAVHLIQFCIAVRQQICGAAQDGRSRRWGEFGSAGTSHAALRTRRVVAGLCPLLLSVQFDFKRPLRRRRRNECPASPGWQPPLRLQFPLHATGGGGIQLSVCERAASSGARCFCSHPNLPSPSPASTCLDPCWGFWLHECSKAPSRLNEENVQVPALQNEHSKQVEVTGPPVFIPQSIPWYSFLFRHC